VLERGDFALALRFAAALWGYWNMRSAIGAERQWLEELLAKTKDAAPSTRAPALLGAGVLAYGAGDLDQAAQRCRAAQAAFEMIGDEEGLTRASAYLAHVAHMRGDDEEAADLCATSLARMARTGARQHAAEIHTIQGLIAQRAGRLPEARERFERSLAIQRHMRWKHHGLRNALRGLGNVAVAQGQPAEAARHFEEGLALSRELDDEAGEAVWLNELGCLRMDEDTLQEAEGHFQAALRIYRRRGDTAREAILLHNLGELALLRGAADVARLAFEHSLRAAERPADDPRRVDTLTFLVLACAWQGDLRRAEALQAEARELALLTGRPALVASADRAAALVAHRAERGSALAARADVRAARAARSAVEAGRAERGPALVLGLWRLVEQGHVELASRVAAVLRGMDVQPQAVGEGKETARVLARLETLGGSTVLPTSRPSNADSGLPAGAAGSVGELADPSALLLALADALDPSDGSPPQPEKGTPS
jgi:tetratricopeptide (TPR) repeat protein